MSWYFSIVSWSACCCACWEANIWFRLCTCNVVDRSKVPRRALGVAFDANQSNSLIASSNAICSNSAFCCLIAMLSPLYLRSKYGLNCSTNPHPICTPFLIILHELDITTQPFRLHSTFVTVSLSILAILLMNAFCSVSLLPITGWTRCGMCSQ